MRSKHQPYELSLYAKRISQYEILPLEEELKLARQYKNGDKEAGQRIINSNLRLALKISKSYFYHGHSPLEIIQEGNLGLVKGLTMFDPERGIKFFSYAVWWVHAYIRNFVYKNSQGTLGYAAHLLSLDAAMHESEDSDDCFKDHLPDDRANQEEEYEAMEKQAFISSMLFSGNGPLDSRERYILKRRFFEEPRPTLDQVARKLNISKERVRQIEMRTLEVIRKHMATEYSLGKEDFIDTNPACHASGDNSGLELRAAG